MRRKILTLASFAVILTVMTVTAFGQLGQTILASIPFPFVVQRTQLPAGNYSFERDQSNPAVLAIRSQDGATSMLVVTESAQAVKAPNQANLVFDKVDGKYFLSELWTVGTDLGRQIPEARAEHRWEQDYAASHSNPKQLSQMITVPCTR
ncbi:MAG: hypothetical protein ACE15E_12115 [Acidobacteriota bacterium]